MKKGKHTRRKTKKARKNGFGLMALVFSLIILTGCAVGSTVAWLIAETDPVVNTFTYGDIDLKLEETKTDEDGNPVDEDGVTGPDKTTAGNAYKMVPGESYLKDPTVTVLADSEACWLFVKLEEKGGVTVSGADGNSVTYSFDNYLSYEVASVWTQLQDENGNAVEGVYFTRVGESSTDMGYQVLNGNTIIVKDTVTRDMLITLDDSSYPSLSITAYAVQYSGFEPEVTQGETEPTKSQIQAAARNAWQTVEDQNADTSGDA